MSSEWCSWLMEDRTRGKSKKWWKCQKVWVWKISFPLCLTLVRMTRFIWKTYIILKSVSNFLFKAKHNDQEANNSTCNLEQWVTFQVLDENMAVLFWMRFIKSLPKLRVITGQKKVYRNRKSISSSWLCSFGTIIFLMSVSLSELNPDPSVRWLTTVFPWRWCLGKHRLHQRTKGQRQRKTHWEETLVVPCWSQCEFPFYFYNFQVKWDTQQEKQSRVWLHLILQAASSTSSFQPTLTQKTLVY